MQELSEFVMDAHKFFFAFQSPIEQYPLQVYASGLLFSPSNSHIKAVFAEHVPKWATIRYGLKDQWPSHLYAIGDLPPLIKVRYSEDGRKLISATKGDVDIRDTITFACLQQFHVPEYHNSKFAEVELSIDGTKVAWCYHELSLIKILDIVHGTWVDIADIAKSHVFGHTLVFSMLGDRIASYPFMGGCIEVWDTSDGSLLCRIPALSESNLHFCFLGDSTNLASVLTQIGEPIQIWCTESGQLKDQISQDSQIRVLEPFLNDSSRLLLIFGRGEVSILDVVLKQSSFNFSSPSVIVSSATISPDGDFIALRAQSRETYIWCPKDQTNFQLEGYYVGAEIFSSDSKLLAIQSEIEFEVWIWDIISRTVICKFNDWNSIWASPAFSPDGRFLALNTYFQCTKIWDISANNLESTEKAKRSVDTNISISTVSFSRDGQWLAAVSNNKPEIELRDKTGALVRVFANTKHVEQIAFSWNGTKLAFGTSDGSFGVIDVAREPSKENASSRILGSGTDTRVTKLEFSKDDSLLAIVQESSMLFFNIESGQYCKVEAPELVYFSAIKFYDNQLAVSIIGNGDIQIWNPTTGVCLKEILAKPPCAVHGHYFAAIDIRLFQGSLQIISSSEVEKGALHITDVVTEKRIRTFKNKEFDILEFGQDNNTIIYSDRGNINLNQFDLSLDQITSKEERVVFQGYGVHGSWVMKDDRPVI